MKKIYLVFLLIPFFIHIQAQTCSWEVTSGWGECMGECEEAMETREVVCICGGEIVADSNCDPGSRPESSRPCTPDGIFNWESSQWSICSGECGIGTQTRTVVCLDESGQQVDDCNCEDPKPETVQACTPPGTFFWQPGPWSTCSAECGPGTQTRTVVCLNESEQQVDECNCLDPKPDTEQSCNLGDCGVGIGVVDPTASLHVEGSLRFVDGNQSEDRYLGSDAMGNASWKDLSSLILPEEPIDVNFNSGFENYGGSFQDVQFYKHFGRVYLTGLVRKTTGTLSGPAGPSEALFTLPVGYRPSSTLTFNARQNTETCRVDITSSGIVFVQNCANGLSWVSLDGISFRN